MIDSKYNWKKYVKDLKKKYKKTILILILVFLNILFIKTNNLK